MTTATAQAPTDAHRAAFFSARGTLQIIETLWELGFYAERPYDGDFEDLSARALAFAESESWDLDDRAALGETIRQYAQEMPLSVLVRSDWHEPGGESTYSQFELLLSTGGPAVRIIGDLDSHCEPYRPQLQYQHWGIEWTDHPESKADALVWFASQFYYGAG